MTAEPENYAPTPAAGVTVADIAAARERLIGVVEQTPLQRSDRLSARYGAEVYLKREDLQVVRSYKLRGAYNLMVQLSAAERAAGVVCASAGNHAQGVAFACRTMGVHGRIYVPTNTPKQKRDRIRHHGGEFVELIARGITYDEAAAAAHTDVATTGATWVHAFDDVRTVAGQGTIGAEITEQLGRVPDLTVIGVGGGGCLTGTATWLRAANPRAAIAGIEPAGARSLAAALDAGGPVALEELDSFVDGAAVRTIGGLAYRYATEVGARVLERSAEPAAVGPGEYVVAGVDEGAVCSSMLELYQNEGIIAEPAGALSIAGLDALAITPGSTVVCLISGGNNDVSRYGEVLERSLVHRGLKHYFLVAFPQEPGALRHFLDQVLGPEDDITLFEYVKRNNRETGEALVGVELGAASDLPALRERMDTSNLSVEWLEPGSPAYRYLT